MTYETWHVVERLASWGGAITTLAGFIASLIVALRTSDILRFLISRVARTSGDHASALAEKYEKSVFRASLVAAGVFLLAFIFSVLGTVATGRISESNERAIREATDKANTAIAGLTSLAKQITPSDYIPLTGEQITTLADALKGKVSEICFVKIGAGISANFAAQIQAALAASRASVHEAIIGMIIPPITGLHVIDPEGSNGVLSRAFETAHVDYNHSLTYLPSVCAMRQPTSVYAVVVGPPH